MLPSVTITEGVDMKFGAKLQELRLAAKLSQPQFAERVGLSVAAIRNYEQGQRIPSWPAIVRISRALNVAVDTFSDCDEVAEKPKGKGKK
jgi:transcriptional regulator with XRE-family HTH domain